MRPGPKYKKSHTCIECYIPIYTYIHFFQIYICMYIYIIFNNLIILKHIRVVRKTIVSRLRILKMDKIPILWRFSQVLERKRKHFIFNLKKKCLTIVYCICIYFLLYFNFINAEIFFGEKIVKGDETQQKWIFFFFENIDASL